MAEDKKSGKGAGKGSEFTERVRQDIAHPRDKVKKRPDPVIDTQPPPAPKPKEK